MINILRAITILKNVKMVIAYFSISQNLIFIQRSFMKT